MRAALALYLAQAQTWPSCPEKGCLPCPANADGRPNCSCLEGYTPDGRAAPSGERVVLGWGPMRGWLSACLPVRCGSAALPPQSSPLEAEDVLPKVFPQTAQFLCNEGYDVETVGSSWDGEVVETGGNASTTPPSSAVPSSRLVVQRCGAAGSFENVTGMTCVPVCGDAMLVATDHLPIYDEQEQCDDGNRNSGDGCDSRCRVEAGFVCTGGSPSAPDSCSPAVASAESLILLSVTGFRAPHVEEVASATRLALSEALSCLRRDLEIIQVISGAESTSTSTAAATTAANSTFEFHAFRQAMQVRFLIKISDVQVLSQSDIQAALQAPQIFGPKLVGAYMQHTTLGDLYVTVVEVRAPTMIGEDNSIQGDFMDFNDYLVLTLSILGSLMGYTCLIAGVTPTLYWCLFVARRPHRIQGYAHYIPEELQKNWAVGLCDWYKSSRATCCLLPCFLPARLAYTWDTVGLIPYWKGVRQAVTCCGLYTFGCWPCGAFLAGNKRSDLKDLVGLGDGVKSNLELEDFISYLFCPICSLVQEAAHVDRAFAAVRVAVKAEKEKAAKAPLQEEEEDEENRNLEAPTIQSMLDEGLNAALDTAVGAFD